MRESRADVGRHVPTTSLLTTSNIITYIIATEWLAAAGCLGPSKSSHYPFYNYTFLHLMGGHEIWAKIHYRLHHCHLLQNYYMLGKGVPHINGWTTTTFGGTLLT